MFFNPAGSVTTFSGEANLCPRCNKKVYFGKKKKGQNCVKPTKHCVSHIHLFVCVCDTVAEKVTSLGKDWHRPCLRCERCSKTLSAGGHAEVRHSLKH